MATIGKVVAVLTARTAPFAKGMAKAARTTRRFAGGVAKIAGKVAKFGLALGAVAVGGLVLIVKAQLKAIDALAKLSRNLGVATEKLQALRLAASIAGVESTKLDKGLKKMIKSVSDLNRGLSTQVDAFKAIGLSADDLRGKSPDEIFKTIADAVKATGKSIGATGALMDIFGAKIGADLVNLLEQGRAGIEAFEKEIQDLGLALTNVDAAKVEAANDAWTRFKAILAGVAQKITVELAPFLEAAIVKIVEMGKAGGRMGGWITSALEGVAKAVAFVANVVQSLRAAWLTLKATVVSVAEFAIRGIVKVVEGLGWLLDKLGVVDAAWTESFINFAEGMKLVGQEARDEAGAALDALGRNRFGDKILDTFDRIRRSAQEAAEEAGKIRDAGDGIEKAVEPAVDKVKELADELAGVKAPRGAPSRPGEFREGQLALLGVGAQREPTATEQVQKEIKKVLENIREDLKRPAPVTIAWQ